MFSATYSLPSFWQRVIATKSELEMLSDSVWPKDGENQDRIEAQLKLGYVLAEYLRKYNRTSNQRKKIILVNDVRFLYEPFYAGSRTFEENCPITNCFVTANSKIYRRSADALILAVILPHKVTPYKPKPRKQVTKNK